MQNYQSSAKKEDHLLQFLYISYIDLPGLQRISNAPHWTASPDTDQSISKHLQSILNKLLPPPIFELS